MRSRKYWWLVLVVVLAMPLIITKACNFTSLPFNSTDTLPIQTWKFGKPISAVAFSPDGRTIAIGAADGTIQLWQLGSETVSHVLTGQSSRVEVLAFSTKGQMLASGSDRNDRAARIWQVQDGTLSQTLVGHTAKVSALSFSPDDTMLVSGSTDATICIWQVANGQLHTVLTGRSEPIFVEADIKRISYNSDGQTLFVGDATDTVQHWQMPAGLLTLSQEGDARRQTSNPVNSMDFARDGQLVATAYISIPEVYIWRSSNGEVLRNWDSPFLWSLAFSPDGQLIAGGGGESLVDDEPPLDTSIRIWQVEDGHEVARLIGHTDNVHSIAWNVNNHLLVSGSEDGTVRVWQVK